ncbi:MAG: CesT family type III secretion system chaperone [Victivallales bacterium]|nr:CesT family type III secretion system chaperone [Victivallales bacterium]
MLSKTLDDILKEFGAKLGLDLAFDESGVCRLELEQLVAVDIRAQEDDGTLTLFAVVREELPDPLSYATVLDLLALALDPALSGGNAPVVGLDDESGTVVMYQVSTPSVLNRKPFIDIFHEFMETFRSVSAMLDNQEAIAAKAKAEAGK